MGKKAFPVVEVGEIGTDQALWTGKKSPAERE